MNPSSFTTQADTVCNTELPYLWRGMQLTAAGTYHDTIPNSYGCEDVYEMVLTVSQSDVVTIHDTICQGGWYTLNGFDTLAAQAGTLYDQLTLTNANGCDSTVNLILQVMPSYLFETTATTCENVPYVWHGGEYSVAGDYYDSLKARGKHHYVAVSGCARKLCGVILAVLRERRPYEPRPSIQSRQKRPSEG